MDEKPVLQIPGPPGGPETIAITLRRSARARRVSLRVSGLDGQVTLTVPSRVALRAAETYARDQAGWIAAALARLAPPVTVGPGVVIPLEGQGRPVQAVAGRGAVRLRDDGTIAVPGPPAQLAPRLRAWLQQLARDRLAAAADRHAALLGRPYRRLVLRDTRSRWGSCSSAGVLMFSWRLVMAPPFVLDYVAAHEVAHLAEMNHSPRFWAVVAQLLPEYRPAQEWLRQNGRGLHVFRFAD